MLEMNTITTALATQAVFSDDGTKRYCLTKAWDDSKPSLAILMLAPSEASGIVLDNTTMLVLNNASRLGYGCVTIVNLFAETGGFGCQSESEEDAENMEAIMAAAQNAEVVVYAAGVGKSQNKVFQQRQQQVLTLLRPIESKLFCLTNELGSIRLQHPLSPAVRKWHLAPLKIDEVLPKQALPAEKTQSKKSRKSDK